MSKQRFFADDLLIAINIKRHRFHLKGLRAILCFKLKKKFCNNNNSKGAVTLTKIADHVINFETHLRSQGRESQSCLGLETEGTETLGLVSISYKIL